MSASLSVNLEQVRRNVREIASRTGVAIYAVVKADAYGLGATRIAPAIADLVGGFAVFSLAEAVAARLWETTHKPSIALGPPDTLEASAYIREHVRPAVSNVEQASALRAAEPILCVDTGMQRFACEPEEIDAVIEAGGCREAFTHAASLEHVRKLREVIGGRKLKLHAAASSLLHEREAVLDAVRPGLAMYRDAVRVWAPLVEAHESRGPVGYSGFSSARHGVILCGYDQGLRKGPCVVNGQRREIREVGMQSAYVELGEGDRLSDEVVLLGEGIDAETVGAAWRCTPHEVLVRLAGAARMGMADEQRV